MINSKLFDSMSGNHISDKEQLLSEPQKDFVDMTAEEKKEFINQLVRLQKNGVPVALEPDVADYMGAFEETSMSLQDAIEASLDGEEV